MDRSEALPLPPPRPLPDDASEERLPVDAAIARLVFRDGVKLGRPVSVSDEEFLARLAALSRKFHGLRHRHEQWTQFVTQARATFERLCASTSADAGAPEGVSGWRNLAYTDLRIENEFEAILFAARGALDILARVIAAHLRGKESTNSYREIRKSLNTCQPGAALTIAIEAAWVAWIEDMTTRRDAAGHYVALTLRSEVREHRPSDGSVSLKRSFVAIPEAPTKASLSVWSVGLPMATQTVGTSITSEGKTIEAHGIFDCNGKLIVRRNGPLPTPEPSLDGNDYVESLVQKVGSHIEEVLAILAEP